MQEQVRICDIAEELGLSTATVSNVIHGKTNKVSDETVQRVTALLEKRQYIPSMAGILLAQNSSGIIGVFVNDHPKYAGHTLRDGFIGLAGCALHGNRGWRTVYDGEKGPVRRGGRPVRVHVEHGWNRHDRLL